MEFRSLRKSSKKYFAKLFLGLMLFEEFLLLLKGQMSHTGYISISDKFDILHLTLATLKVSQANWYFHES